MFAFAFGLAQPLQAKEIALTFDDSPAESSLHFESNQRTDELLKKLKELSVPPVIVFANPCKGVDSESTLRQLKKYRDDGHLIGNHTCTHPRLDTVGIADFKADSKKADSLLAPYFSGQKYFRFPFLNEGADPKVRDEMRMWLHKNKYRNGMVSADNEDPIFSYKINQAKQQGKKIDYEKVKELFLDHITSSLKCADDLAKKVLGYSPKHVLLLHERDATIMFIDSLATELRDKGWKIISAVDAYQDKLYLETPANTHAGNGIISQIAFEKTGKKTVCYDFESLKRKLNQVLGLDKL